MARDGAAELVINGDFVDFLAEEYDGRFRPFAGDAGSAVEVLERLLDEEQRPEEAAVFEALRDLVRGGSWLTLILGNHDVELAIPEVRARLIEALGGPCERIAFVDEEAYVVGDAHVEHGNRFDEWNAIAPEALERLRAGDPEGFRPPPGSQLVAHVMNPIKIEHPFIDLLKPEVKAAVPVLLALDPSSRYRLGTIAKYAAQAQQRARHIRWSGKVPISATPADEGTEEELSPDEALQQLIVGVINDEAHREALYAAAAASRRALRTPGRHDIAAFTSNELIGWASLILGSGDHLTSLSNALGTLYRDMSFETALESDERMRRLAERPGSSIRWVILGHTHLAKRQEMWSGRWYLNSGTWADLLPFPEWVLQSSTRPELERFLQDMRDKRLGAWLRPMPTYVRMELDGEHISETALEPYPNREGGSA